MLTEVQDLLERIENLRGQVRDLVADLPAEALNWRPIEGSDDHAMNSLAVMAAHVAGAEHFWAGEVVGQLPASRNRDAEFVTEVDGAGPLLERLDEVAEETRRVLQTVTEDDLERKYAVREHRVSGRWALLHVIDHTALHLGHMQITYQLWNSGSGVDSPRWFQRV